MGGSGDFAANVFVGAHFADPPAEAVRPDVTSERNTISIFGAGAVELLAREMTRDLKRLLAEGLRQSRDTGTDIRVPLVSKGVSFGSVVARPDGSFDAAELRGVDPDLTVKPFGIKGVAISLREFTINALNQHHGIQPIERFGWERTGLVDFDEDGVDVEFTIGQVTALTLFQAALPAPRNQAPRNAAEAKRWAHGERLFREVMCADCHVPELPLAEATFSEPNPYNRPGNLVPADVDHVVQLRLPIGGPRDGIRRVNGRLVVAAYSDLRRHRICDADDPFFCNERRRQDNVPTDQFMTPRLWDLATSAPYGHRGDCSTVSEAILHHSAEGAASRDAFLRLDDGDKRALISFLLSLGGDSQIR